ncbi:hypothetical protein F2Z80_24740 [Vibrio fortis]|uniref:Uncharacterized protein n=1 Tax=Vibrio fortis TaxID=212667 RepID=A0A5N3S0L6_9VIBR|nr:hypothetical protein [Vibrio fortis]KAB0300290.1 hypothetical protein F2Z80_24740 [Vibrio fortis]
MNFLKNLLKILFAIVVISLLAGVGYYFYDQYEQEKKDHFELSFATEKAWAWYDKYDRVQYRTLEENKTVLRKVKLNKNYVIYAYKNDDYSLTAMVKFLTKCKPNREIETSQTFSDGTPKVLKCNEKGDALHYQVKWNGKNTDFTWEENLDGFSLSENFTYWDFSKLDQEVTLSKAQ